MKKKTISNRLTKAGYLKTLPASIRAAIRVVTEKRIFSNVGFDCSAIFPPISPPTVPPIARGIAIR